MFELSALFLLPFASILYVFAMGIADLRSTQVAIRTDERSTRRS